MPPVRMRWVRGENEVAAWVIRIPLATQGMGKEILGLVSSVNQLLRIIRLFVRGSRLIIRGKYINFVRGVYVRS